MMTSISNLQLFLAENPLIVVLTFLLIAVALFIQNKLRMDVIALLVILAFNLSGILTTAEVFAGLSDPNIILIGLLFIIGEALVRTGVAYQVSEWLMRAAKNSEAKMLVLLMTAVATLGSFMSSTGIVAIFIPVVLAICQKMNISPRRLMMPLSVAGLISGMMTLIATAPNLVVNSELIRATNTRLSFFSFTPIGVMILILGIGYMLLVRQWLSDASKPNKENKPSIYDLIEQYGLQGRTKCLVIQTDSPFIEKRLDELHLRSLYNLDIVAIERWKHFRPIFITASGNSELKAKDMLLIDMADTEFDLNTFCQQNKLKLITTDEQYFERRNQSIGMAELTPVPDSHTIGKTPRDLRFRSHYGLNVAAIKRNGEILQGNISDTAFQIGDSILVVGEWKQIQQIHANRDFFLLNYPAEISLASPAQSQAPHAIFSIIIMVGLMISGIVPNVIAALIGCLLLGKFRCVDAQSAYESIHWPSMILIIGMMPFSIALQKTGGTTLIVEFMLNLIGGWDHHAILMSIFILCAIVSLFISNTATAIIMAPIAITIATKLGVSPVPFVMTVAIAASAAFMTPISSPVNTMVLEPGGYKFIDFIKIGVPFTIIVMLATVFVVPLLFPL